MDCFFPLLSQMTKVMQVPLSYAEDIIGIGGANIGYIRRTSGAVLTVQESRGMPEEINIEIKGTSSEVQAAEQLIQVWSSSLVVRPSPCTPLFLLPILWTLVICSFI